EFERHEGKHRIQFRLFRVRVLRAQRVEHDVEELELAHDEVLAEHETHPVIENEAQLEYLLARLEMLPHLVRFKVLATAAEDRAARTPRPAPGPAAACHQSTTPSSGPGATRRGPSGSPESGPAPRGPG